MYLSRHLTSQKGLSLLQHKVYYIFPKVIARIITERVGILHTLETGLRAFVVPISQAGHHTHHITTGVYIPHTFQPKLAALSTSDMLTPLVHAADEITTGGEVSINRIARNHLVTRLLVGWMKVRGLARSPTRKASEKLSVLRVARDTPRINSEKDFVS